MILSSQLSPAALLKLSLAGVILAVGLALPFSGLAADQEDSSFIVRDPAASLEWQKVDLEDRLQSKIQKSISTSLPFSPFVVSVNISLKAKPEAESEKTPTEKNPTDKARVALGKLDLDAPAYGDSESNLFSNIESVRVNVILDSSVSEMKKDLVKKIINNALGSLSQDQIDLTVDKADLSQKEERDFKKWLIELKLPIGFLLATLILSILTLVLFSGYRTLETRKISVMEAQGARAQEDFQNRAERPERSEREAPAQRAAEAPAPMVGSGSSTHATETAVSGFDKFRTLLKEAPDQASNLIKQWVKAPVKEAREALSALPQVLSTEEFLVIFQHLPMDDRKIWRRILSSSMGTQDLAIANQYISSQIVDSLLSSQPELDQELKKLISELDVSETLELANSDPELGGILVNLLPTNQVSQVYALADTGLASKVTVASLKFSPALLLEKASQLKQTIKKIKSRAKLQSVPFMDKTAELFSQLSPDKEGSILSALAEAGEYILLQTTAQQYFPSELILQLPESLLKACLDRFTLPRRAEFIVSREAAERTVLSDASGKPGSKLRELLDVEIQQVQGDALRLRRAERAKEAFWKEFVQQVRARIRGNELAAEQAEPVLNAWLSQKTNGMLGGQIGDQGHGASSPTV